MVTRNKFLPGFLFAGLIITMISCTGVPFLVPNPPAAEKTETERPAEKEKKKPSPSPVPRDTIDFAVAFADDTGPEEKGWPAETGKALEAPESVSIQRDFVLVPVNMIRVALRRNVSRIILHTGDTMEVHTSSLKRPARCMGSITVETKRIGSIAITVNNGPPHIVALPCTLVALNRSSCFILGKNRYRGSIIINGEGPFALVNYIAVDDYLRGVLPPEMGKRSSKEIEALKAQAIVARTYAYRRMIGAGNGLFDVLGTVADQVYGGADVETAEADEAVNATRGLVLLWQDSLADVYYHSTCGGRTAGIEVWGGNSSCEYLRSKNDIAPDGLAYCSFSPAFTWEESWSAGDLSKILRTTTGQVSSDARFEGRLRAIKIEQRFRCGRVKTCQFIGRGGSIACGGDKIRYVLRRKNVSGEILPSTNFTVEKNGPDTFMLRGRGYGHGVGMCQMGAIGRSRRGQDFKQILSAYFGPAGIGRIEFVPPR